MKLSEYLKQNGMTTKDYFEMRKRKEEGKTTLADYRREQLNSFKSRYESLTNELDSLYKGYQTRFFDEKGTPKVGYRENTSDFYNDYLSQKNYLESEIEELGSFLSGNQNSFDAETYKGIQEYLSASKDSLNKMLTAYKTDSDLFSKFSNELEYNDAVKIGELNDMPSADIEKQMGISKDAYETEVAPLKEELDQLNRDIRFYGRGDRSRFSSAKDYNDAKIRRDELKKQITNLQGKNGIAYTTSSGQNITWSSLYNAKKYEEDINALYNEMSAMPDWAEQSKYKPTYDTSKGGRNPLNAGDDDYERANHPNVGVNGVEDIYYASQTNEKEKELFNYLAHTKGTDYAINWLMANEDVYKERRSKQNIKYAQQMAKEMPVLSDAIAVAGSLVTPFEYLGNVITGNAGERINSADISSAIKGTRMEQIDWEVGGWDVFDFLYGTGTSMAESALAMSMFGGLGGVSLGLNAAAQSTNDALDRGMSKGQAFTSGLASGIFEGIFESWSIGAFGDLTKNLNRADFRNVAKYVGKNMWNNAKEETLTEIANIAYDTLFNGDFSQYETAIRQYMNSGLSETDAKLQVAKELGIQVAEAAGSGALMGFGFGVSGGVKVRSNITQMGRQIKDSGETRNLFDLGKSLGEGTESYEMANKITDKSKAFAIGQLYGIAAEDIANANKSDIVKSLERKGYDTEKANNLAELMLDPENTMFKNSRGISAPGQTYNDTINNPNSTVGQRNEALESILRSVAENRAQKENKKKGKTESASAKKTQSALPLASNYVEKRAEQLVASGIPIEQAVQIAQGEFAENKGNLPTQEENPIESKFESNPEGRDFDTVSGRIIESKKLVSSQKDNMAFEVAYDDGTTETVDAKNISFGNDGEALVYSMVMDMNVPVGIAEQLISGYNGNDVKSAATYVNGMREAFVFGKHNQEADLHNGAYASQLTEKQRNNAFKAGGIYAKEKAIADEKAIKGETKPTDTKKQEGKVHFEGDKLSLKSVQDVSIKSLNVLSKALGKDFHIYESYKDANGHRVYKDANGNIKKAPNGFYRQLDGSIWIDLNAGNSGQGTMLYTVAHELTHFIKQWSPTKFKALADFLVEQYGKEGVSVHELVLAQQEKARKNKREISYDAAFEEMVADSMETMLTDGKVIRELATRDKGLFDKIKSWIDNLLRRLKKEYQNYSPESAEGQLLLEMTETFKEVQKLFADALTDASDNYQVKKGQKNTTTEGDVKLQARELQRKDPTTLKEEELTSLLEFAKDKMLSDDTYIPVRINTPQILIAFAKEFGHTLENHPLAMQVYKARQALSNEENWDGDYKDKPHDLLPEEVIGIIRAMNNPSHLVFQTENERFAEIVKFEKDGSKEKAYAIVDFSDVNKNPDLMNGYKGGKYNILVTVYPSEDSADLKKYLSNKNHKVLTGEQMKKKGISQGSYGGNTPSLLNDSPFFEDSIPQTSKKSQEKLSDRDGDTYTRIKEMQIELNELRETIKEMQNSEDFKSVHDKLSKAIDEGNVDEGIKAYKEWQEKSGYAELSQRRDALQLEFENLRKSFNEEIADKALKEEKDAIAKSGLSEADYFRKQAVKEFGYTPYFYDAGYITPNGKMLNFSGEKGKHFGSRGQDHRAIGIIYANAEGTQAMVKFMNEGNIRLMPESPGFDIYTQAEPTKEQYGTIRRFIYEYAKEGFFNVDISDESGKVIGSLEYENNINPTRIINDIKNYYATGEIRQQSEVDKFRYSDRNSEGNTLTQEQVEFFKDSKVRDENGNLLVVYHGTRKADFTVFKRNVNFFTDSEEMADSYAPNGELYKGYLNIANPFIVDANGEKWSKIPVDDSIKNLLLKYGAGVFKENGKWRTTPADIVSAIQDGIDDGEFDYDGVIIKNVDDTGSYYKGKDNIIATDYISFNSNQFKNIDNKNPSTDPDIRYSERDYAPTFYSQMGKVVEGVKQEKLAANSVVNMLRGKGVKAEEIRWSGIVPFLEGKKSVTKAELQEFVAGSMLQIEENELNIANVDELDKKFKEYTGDSLSDLYDDIYKFNAKSFLETLVYSYAEYGFVNKEQYRELERLANKIEESKTKWHKYKLDGGENYREIVFTLPNSSYHNQMMRVHWGEDAEGVLVHARIQDFDVNGKKMLFIEEIQSDWHNEGHKDGYQEDSKFKELKELEAKANETFYAVEDYSTELTGLAGEYEAVAKTQKGRELLRAKIKAEKELKQAQAQFDSKVPDAPFKENYHEFVLKRLLRMAAEQGYDSIGWTPSEIQSDRWSDEFAEAYRIEYDQEMPKFLRKYGRQWGAKVENTSIPKQTVDGRERILKETELENVKRDIESEKRELARHYDSYEKARIQMSIDSMEKTVATLEKELSASLNVWSMDITDSMKNSVLYEGQVLYSERDDSSVSTRSLLANALEGAAQNDIEKNKLAQYKEKIALIEAEQEKLHELREKLFTKGIKGAERREIQEEATRTANRINTYDRQLFNLESTTALKNVLTREKELARKRQKQKDNENLRAYKEKVAETTRQLLEKNRESRQKAIEGRTKTEMRHKVKKVVNDLNNLLLNPTKERHVPEAMRVAVAEALAIVNMDTVDADTRVAHYNDLIAKANDPDVIASLTESRDRILEQGNKLGEKLAKLKEAYGEIEASTDDSLKSMYDDVIYSKIEKVQKDVGKTPLRNMTLEQLESVYELYKMVLTTVRDSNKAFAEDLKMTRQALGSNTFAEIKDNNKERDRIKFESIEKFGWKNLKPMQAMKTIGSSILQQLWNNILYGQEVFAQDYDEAVKFAKEMKKKYGYNEWNLDKLYSFESKSGKVMKVNLEQMMSIYAYSKRKQADEHIEEGGILLNESIIKEKKFGRTVEVKVNDSTAYRLDKMRVDEIIDTLEKEFPGAKDFVDEMQKYLSETMGEKGNEVSMKMYGIKLFKEEHYFPLKSSKDFMESANAKLKGDVKIKNKGMTKATVEHASNPIVLEGFLDVWANHINEMSMYHGLVLPLEDFSRTLNYGFKADDKLNTDAESVKTALRSAFGESADNYLNELLKAINGGVLHDSSTEIADKWISRFKKSKVMASLSVIVQQPTAIIRAMGIIEPKYFVTQNFHHKATWEELKKYCPTAIIKETGSFDTNMGRTIVDMIKEDRKFTEKVGDALGKAPAYMDEMGWNMIWRALKNKVATEQNLSGEELLKECGRQMTLIINETQVYDSVMSRNELMRSKSAFTKMATSFMGEPTTVANMVYGAVLDFKRGNKKIASKTVAAVISSVVINGLVSSLVYAFRDDDEEKTFLEKYLSSATTEVLDGINPLTYIPYVKDAYSLFQGYDVERTDMAIIGDVVDAIEDFYNVLDPEAYEDKSGGEIAKHIYENAKPLLTSICDMFGLPVGNILRDAEAIIVNDNLSMSKTTGVGIGLAVKDGWIDSSPKIVQKFVDDEKYHKLYLIANNGDTTYVRGEVAEMVEAKVESGKTKKEAQSSVRSSFISSYRDTYKKAYKNKDAEEMNRIRKFLYATGLWNSLTELDSLLAKWRKAD